MAYQALYRQWRPTSFSSVVAQESIMATLRNQIKTHRIAHAYLFCGSRGTGKTSTAKILARAMNCENPVDGDACGQCESCQRLLKEESLDVVEMDAASNNGVDEIRDLRETVKYPPQYGKYKVYIIDEVHMLSTSAFNAFLKTLEEPPDYLVFILATTEPQKLPATILSRCQRFDFGRIPAHQIAGRLREVVDASGVTAEESALQMIARAAEGGMRDALSILDMCMGYGKDVDEKLVRKVLGTSDRQFLFRFAEALELEDPVSLIHMIDEVMRDGREPVVFAKDVSHHVRALMMAKCCGDDLSAILEITKEDAQEYQTQAERFTVTRLMKLLDLYMRVETDIRTASSPRLALETATMKACLRLQETDATALNDRIAELEKQLDDMREKLSSGVLQAAPPPAKTQKTKPSENVPKEPKAVQQASLTPTGRNADDVWREALTTLKKNAPGVSSFLMMGRYIGFREGAYCWEAPLGQEIFVSMLAKDENKARIEEALTNAAGVESRFHPAAMVPEQESDADDQKVLDGLKAAFGDANVLVQDE